MVARQAYEHEAAQQRVEYHVGGHDLAARSRSAGEESRQL